MLRASGDMFGFGFEFERISASFALTYMRTLPRGLQRIKHVILFRIRFLQTSRERLFRADIFQFRCNFESPHVFMKGSKTLSTNVQPWGKLRETWAGHVGEELATDVLKYRRSNHMTCRLDGFFARPYLVTSSQP